MRILALDYGSARCGAALCDPSETVVTPIEPVAAAATKAGTRAPAAPGGAAGGRVCRGRPAALAAGDRHRADRRGAGLRGAARAAPGRANPGGAARRAPDDPACPARPVTD